MPATSDFLVKSNGKYGIMGSDTSTKVRIAYDEIIKVKELGINIDTIAGYNNSDIVKNIIEEPYFE